MLWQLLACHESSGLFHKLLEIDRLGTGVLRGDLPLTFSRSLILPLFYSLTFSLIFSHCLTV